MDFRIQVLDEKIKWIRINAWISQKNNIKIIIGTGTATDITDIKSHYESLRQFDDKKKTALQMLSHDVLGCFCNITTAIAILNDYDEIRNNEEIMEMVNVIIRSTKRGVARIREATNSEFQQTDITFKRKEQAPLPLAGIATTAREKIAILNKKIVYL